MTLAEHIVDVLLDDLGSENVPVKIRMANNAVVDGLFNGYYDLSAMGQAPRTSVAYKLPDGSWTHGILKAGEQILTPVPSFEEWKAAEEQKKQAVTGAPAKATFWASSGSGAY